MEYGRRCYTRHPHAGAPHLCESGRQGRCRQGCLGARAFGLLRGAGGQCKNARFKFVLAAKGKSDSGEKQELLGGTVVLKASARTLSRKQWEGALYLDLPPVDLPATLTAIPYYQWANRGKNPMRVWINEKR